jgi:selenide,water dikinase
MATLNAKAAEAAAGFAIHACTDITGFGLLGHLSEMAKASGTRAEIAGAALPLLPDAAAAAAMGLVPAGAYANRSYLTAVTFADDVPAHLATCASTRRPPAGSCSPCRPPRPTPCLSP